VEVFKEFVLKSSSYRRRGSLDCLQHTNQPFTDRCELRASFVNFDKILWQHERHLYSQVQLVIAHIHAKYRRLEDHTWLLMDCTGAELQQAQQGSPKSLEAFW